MQEISKIHVGLDVHKDSFGVESTVISTARIQVQSAALCSTHYTKAIKTAWNTAAWGAEPSTD